MQLNEIRCCFSGAVEPRFCGPADRRAFAARPIRAGEVIIRNRPTAYALLDEHCSERCSYCLSTSRRQTSTSEASSKSSRLLRCSRCQEAKYCSRRCQEKDFSLHKVECHEANLLFGRENGGTTIGNNNDARLLVRNFLALRQSPEHCREIDDQGIPTTCCGCAHFGSLTRANTMNAVSPVDVSQARRAAKAIWNQRKGLQMDSKISKKTTFPIQLSELQEQMELDLRRFHVNNFGVTDSMVRVCASGVYPLGALLNHSCAPNCILRYSFEQQQHRPPVMEVVAACDIDQGDELTHSYVELVCPTSSRQAKLKLLYGFNCDCPRCCPVKTDDFSFHVPENYLSIQSSELIQWIILHNNPSIQQSPEALIAFDQEKILQPLSDSHATKAAQEKLEIARRCLINESVQDELDAFREAVGLLEEAAKHEEQSSLQALFSLELYQARGDRLGSLIVAGDIPEAISECEHVVAYLCLALKHMPNHALLGLQLFTLGDLYEAGGFGTHAEPVFHWAYQVLQVSHGLNSDITRLLAEKLRVC